MNIVVDVHVALVCGDVYVSIITKGKPNEELPIIYYGVTMSCTILRSYYRVTMSTTILHVFNRKIVNTTREYRIFQKNIV